MYSTDQHLQLGKFAELSDKLFELGVITSDSFTGEIGEYIACTHFKLEKSKRSTQAIDGICSRGLKYQVKAKIVSGRSNAVSCSNLKPHLFDYLAVVYFDSNYSPFQIVRIPTKYVTDAKFNVTRAVLAHPDVLVDTNIIIAPPIKALLKEFADTFSILKYSGVIRSRHIVGDIGEYYACKTLNLEICSKLNERGFDAINKAGIKFEVKTRRVYESGRRGSDSRRLNNLSGKSADFLIVVALDRSFRCAGMWLIPFTNIRFPESVHLDIVNQKIGVYNIIPSTIPWLLTKTDRDPKKPYFPLLSNGGTKPIIIKAPKGKHKIKSLPPKRLPSKAVRIANNSNKKFIVFVSILATFIFLLFVQRC